MLNIDIFDDFISVGAAKGISKYGTAILNQDFSSGMSGYDIEEMVKAVLSKNDAYSDIFQNFTFDSEYSMFCMYYNHNGEKKNVKVTDEAIAKCTEYVTILNNLIKNEYVNSVTTDLNTKPNIYDIRKS